MIREGFPKSVRSLPIVTVIVPAYNGEGTVLKTIESIIKQKQNSLELIVIDDNSKDSTASLVNDFMKHETFSGEFKLVHQNKILDSQGH